MASLCMYLNLYAQFTYKLHHVFIIINFLENKQLSMDADKESKCTVIVVTVFVIIGLLSAALGFAAEANAPRVNHTYISCRHT